jgi:rhodanese-related sulfurtransferase
MEHITVEQLRAWMLDSQIEYTLIDVREASEHAEGNLGGTLIPLSEVVKRYQEFGCAKPVVVYCRKGVRSQIAIQRIEALLPESQRLLNLIGGIEAWKKQFPLPS